MDNSKKKPWSRASAFALAVSMCAGIVGSTFIGTGLDSGLVDTFSVSAATTIAPGTYYDAGTMVLNGYYDSSFNNTYSVYNDTWLSKDVTSVMSSGITLPGTTDINATNHNTTMMCWKDHIHSTTCVEEGVPGAKFGTETNNADGMLYNYVAEGEAVEVGDEIEITWEIKAWRAKKRDSDPANYNSKDADNNGFITADELGLTTTERIKSEWDYETFFEIAAPKWASGNTDWDQYKTGKCLTWGAQDLSTGKPWLEIETIPYVDASNPGGMKLTGYTRAGDISPGAPVTINELNNSKHLPLYTKHASGCKYVSTGGTGPCNCTYANIVAGNGGNVPFFNVSDMFRLYWESNTIEAINKLNDSLGKDPLTGIRLYDVVASTTFSRDGGSTWVSGYIDGVASENYRFIFDAVDFNGVDSISKHFRKMIRSELYSDYFGGKKTDTATKETTEMANISTPFKTVASLRYDTTSDYQRSGGTISKRFAKAPTVTIETDAYINSAPIKMGDANAQTATAMKVADEVVLHISSSDALNARFYKLKGQVYAIESDGSLTAIAGAVNNGSTGTTIEVPAGATSSAKTTINFVFDATGLAGKSAIVMYDVYDENNTLVCEHRDPADDRQKVYFPVIDTVAVDSISNNHSAKTNLNSTVIDTVSYKNLLPGAYILRGTLVDKATGSTIATEEAIFTVEGNAPARGEEEIEFTFNSTNYADKDVVVFEEIIATDDNGTEYVVASHKDLDDADQTVHYDNNPLILNGTVATSTDTQSHIGAVRATANIKDEISLSGVRTEQDNATYTIVGEIYVIDETGAAVPFCIDGKPVTKTDKNVKFATEDVTYTMQFDSFDSTGLAGKTIVIYETVTEDGTGKSVSHKDATAESQMIWFPAVDTVAIDKLTETHSGKADGTSVTVVDTVKLDNLVPNENYVLKSVAMYRDSNGLVGEAATVTSSAFTTTKPSVSMTVELKFNPETVFSAINASNPDANEFDIVICEYLISGRGSSEYVRHYDLADTDQTVHYSRTAASMSIETDAIDLISNSQQGIVGKSNIQDTISYTNAKKGKSYIAKARLVTIEDGDVVPVKDSKGNEISNTKTFISSETGEGKVEINVSSASFDTTALAGKTVIVFEQIFEGTTIAEGATPVAAHESIADERQMVYYPSIDTVAIDKDEKGHTGFATDKVTIVDTVTYTNLIPGENYTLTGTLMTMDEDGKVVNVLKGEGENVVVTNDFTPTESEGTVNMTFTFDGTEYGKHSIVVYESLSSASASATGKKIVFVSHNDMNDADQTVYYKPNKPGITTEAINGRTKLSVGKPTSSDTIVDTVKYVGLEENTAYTVIGTLYKVDPTTKKAVNFRDSSNRAVTATTNFTTTDSDSGSVEVEFKFNSSDCKNVTIVVFEQIYLASDVVNGVPTGKPIAVHEDPEDTKQQVVYRAISTEAVDATTYSHSGVLAKDASVIDRVYYTDLDPDKEYVITGTIYNKKTGLPLTERSGNTGWAITSSNNKNGHTLNTSGEVSVTTDPFFPDNTVGYKDINFIFDSTKLSGKDIVVFETIYDVSGDAPVKVASHEDLDDALQTISYPTIKTYATGSDYVSKIIPATAETVVMDEIKLSNLVVGQDYVLEATLATVTKTKNSKTGEVIANASEIDALTAACRFTATAEDMTKYLEAKFDGTEYAGKDIVVLVYLYTTFDIEDSEAEKYLVYAHDDPTNEDETVSIPSMRTVASALNNEEKMLDPIAGETFVDEVFYTGLKAGHVYTVSGKIVDKETGKTISASASSTFTATYEKDKTEGSVKVTFKGVNLSKMAGRSIVVYETIYDGSKAIATHEDINDSNQTLTISDPTVQTLLAETETGAKTVNVGTELNLTDTITYTGLVPGNTYVTVSTLVDKATGKTIVDDKGNTTVITGRPFVAESESLEIEADYMFTNMELGGKTLVAYNDLYRVVNGRRYLLVSEHDLKNTDQSVVLTEDATCTTVATDKTTGSHTLTYTKNAAIVDKVTYKGLEAGKTYTITATVHDKNGTSVPTSADGMTTAGSTTAGSAGNGLFAPVTKTFTAKDRTGVVEVTIPVDVTAAAGKTLVVFEVITEGGTVVCSHEDIDDLNQTVYVNAVDTVLTAGNGTSKVVPAAKGTKLIDIVTFEGLTPGRTYQITGHILDREASISADNIIVTDTAEEIIIDGSEGSDVTNGGRVIATKILSFTPKASSGSIAVEFTVNTSALGGHHLVAFETIKDKTSGVVVGEHKDINSANQTVTVKTSTRVYTGDMSDHSDICDDENCVVCNHD